MESSSAIIGADSAGTRASDAGGPAAEAAGVVGEYLRAFYTGDFAAARCVVAEKFSFCGPFLQVNGAAEFFSGAEGLRQIVRGHRMVRQWTDGGDVCSWYEVDIETPAGGGSLPMCEWHRVDGGVLVAGRILFDTAVFRALVPAR